MSSNTKMSYFYRDASNYKVHTTVVFAGVISPLQEEIIRSRLEDEWSFIPSQVGLRDLQYEMPTEPNSEDDNAWHELEGFATTSEAPTTETSLDEIVATFKKVEWDQLSAEMALGI